MRTGEPAPAPVGPSEIARVIRNLLDNAIRHAPDGSRVLIELTPQEAGILVRVVDQGEGFEPASGQRLLVDPGRVEPRPGRASGAGLGLVIARGLVEAHGGRFWVEDGVGGRVAFWVPATA
ncbi:MAG: ATP-binding protein [Chloroflexi bacterium]|nr:ATP-binding protein [Chloroflexota bacterium]